MTLSFKTSLMQIASLTSCLVLFSLAQPLQADGFHYQIQATSQFVGNATGELTNIKMDWTYDPELTAILLEDEDLSEANKAATLKQRAADILGDLDKLGYFSKLSVNDQAADTTTVQDYNMVLTADQSMILSFQLPLKTPIAVAGKKLSLSLADPDGVGQLYYKNPQDASIDANLTKICTQPSLTKATIDMANDHKIEIPTAQIECK